MPSIHFYANEYLLMYSFGLKKEFRFHPLSAQEKVELSILCITKSANCNRGGAVEGILGALYKKQEEAFTSCNRTRFNVR
jgi:hypothetical protein